MTKNIEKRLDRVEDLVRGWNRRLSNIESARKHYLRRRMSKRNKVMAKVRRLVTKMEKLDRVLGALKIEKKSHVGERLTIVMLRQYDKKKLMRILRTDDRTAFQCSAEDAAILRSLIESSQASEAVGGT